MSIIFWNDNVRQPSEAHSSTSSAHMHQLNLQSGSRTVGKDVYVKQAVVIALSRLRDNAFHRHSRWLYIQQQSSSSSSNRFIEHDLSTRKLGPSSGIRPSFLNRPIYTFINGSV